MDERTTAVQIRNDGEKKKTGCAAASCILNYLFFTFHFSLFTFRFAIPLLLVCLCWTASAPAQEFRVYTRVYDEGGTFNYSAPMLQKDAPIIARSLTLFHAGKVYDYVDEIGEVLVFEAAHNRFTILNGSRMLSAVVDLDEIKQLVKVLERETDGYVQKLEQEGDPRSALGIQPLRFQLSPTFDVHYANEKRKLTLSSRYFRYDVQCAEAATSEAVDAYLRYADWMARLNSVMHPHSLLPGPRLVLNEELRAKRQIPVEVALSADLESQIRLRARHQIHWQLDAKDRSLIHQWETLLKHADMRQVSFRDYQRAVLLSRAN